MKFYKAIKGTDVYEKYGDELIYDEVVAFQMKTWERRQVEDATAEDLAEAFNALDELDPDIYPRIAKAFDKVFDKKKDED